MSDWGLERVKRDWVPDWFWRLFCIGNLATFTPWKQLLTKLPPSAPEENPFGDFDDFGGPTVGYCSKCGEARDSFYTCRSGGETVPKNQPADADP